MKQLDATPLKVGEPPREVNEGVASIAVTSVLYSKDTWPLITQALAEADRGATSERALGSIAKVETREAERTLSVTAQAPRGGFLHRSYLAK